MITHMVFWKLQEENKAENAQRIKQRLEALVGVVPGLLEMRVGTNLIDGGEYDLALCSRFADMAALHGYETHPEHLKVRAFVQQVRVGRAAVDFEE